MHGSSPPSTIDIEPTGLTTSSESSDMGKAPTVRVGYLFKFALPLALTFLMMSGSAPIVSTGIARMHGPEGERIHLAAFLPAFILSVFLYSPMFAARNVAIRTITDRRSLERFAIFFSAVAGLCCLIIVTVSQWEVAGVFVLQRCLGSDELTTQLAREGMLYFAPVPNAIDLSCFPLFFQSFP